MFKRVVYFRIKSRKVFQFFLPFVVRRRIFVLRSFCRSFSFPPRFGLHQCEKKMKGFSLYFFYFNLKNLFSYFSPTLIVLVLWCCLRCRLGVSMESRNVSSCRSLCRYHTKHTCAGIQTTIASSVSVIES